jgi:hypothetical protein
MGPTRKELLRHIVDLIVATEDLTRATEEQTQVYRALREDIARLSRQPRLRRIVAHHGLERPGTRMSPTVTPMPAPRPK